MDRSLEKYNIQVDCSSIKAQYNKAVLENDKEKMLFLDRAAAQKLGPKISRLVAAEMKKGSKEKADFIKTASDKVQLHFIEREMKKLQNEMTALAKEEKVFSHNQNEVQKVVAGIEENVQSIKNEQISAIESDRLIKIIGSHIFDIDHQIKEERKALDSMRRETLTPNRMLLVAQSVYTRGKSKRITKEFNDISKLREKYEIAFFEFNTKNKPGFLNLTGKKAYKLEVEKFEKWQQDISVRENKNNKEIAEMKIVFAKPESKEKIARMIDSMQQRNEIRLKRVAGFKEEITKLGLQKSKLLNLKKHVFRYKKQLFVTGDLSKDNLLSQSNRITNQIKQAVNIPAAKTSGGISARIMHEKDNENDGYGY